MLVVPKERGQIFGVTGVFDIAKEVNEVLKFSPDVLFLFFGIHVDVTVQHDVGFEDIR